MDINVNAVFYGMQAAAPLLRESTKNPSIINISSIAGIEGFNNLVGYVTSKWAVRGMTKAVAMDLGPAGVRIKSKIGRASCRRRGRSHGQRGKREHNEGR